MDEAMARIVVTMEAAAHAIEDATQAMEEFLEAWNGLPEDVKAAVRDA